MHLAVFPLPHGTVERKKLFDTSRVQLLGNFFFVIRPGVGGIPMRTSSRLTMLVADLRLV